MTPEQRIEHRISEAIARLYNVWYASGALEYVRGAPLPRSYRGWRMPIGAYLVKMPVTRTQVTRLAGYIRAEHENVRDDDVPPC